MIKDTKVSVIDRLPASDK